MQRPPTVQHTPTRPHANASAALAAASSPFMSHQRPSMPPGMTGAGSAPGSGNGPTGGIGSAGIPGGGYGGLASQLGGAANRAAVAAMAAASAASGSAGGGLSNDDFPALGASSQQHSSQQQHFPNGSPAPQSALAAAAAAAAAAEQASAAAALQHQASQREAHRLGLLNGAGGNGGPSSSPQQANRAAAAAAALSAARGGFGDLDRNYANKLGSSQVSGLPALSTNTGSGAQSWTHIGSGIEGNAPNGVNASGPPTSVTTPASQILFSSVDRFGLTGLLRIIKLQASGVGAGGANGASPDDVGLLALGNDLQSLGLDVSADGALHAEFHTPWSSDSHPLQRSQRAMVEPDFHLPSCYNVQPPPPAQNKMASFSDETLFFIFYSTPRDLLQEVAAMELHHRNWRFHKELQLWLTKEHNMEPTQKTPMYEKGQYVFWDLESWQRVTKNFVLLYELLEDRPPLGAAAHLAHQQQQQAMQHQQNSVAPATPGPATASAAAAAASVSS